MADNPRRPGDPVVGPADPATRRRMIEERRQRAIKEDRERSSTPAPAAPSAPAPHRELRRGPAGRTISDTVDNAVRGRDNELNEKIRRVDRETGFTRSR